MDHTNRLVPVEFVSALLGFEDVRRFTLRSFEAGPVWELRPERGGYPQFILFKADGVLSDYSPALPAAVIGSLGARDARELDCFVVAVVPEDIAKTTVNLLSPVVVNLKTGLAAQVVLEDRAYPLRHPVFGGRG